jgi:hypothetical protein
MCDDRRNSRSPRAPAFPNSTPLRSTVATSGELVTSGAAMLARALSIAIALACACVPRGTVEPTPVASAPIEPAPPRDWLQPPEHATPLADKPPPLPESVVPIDTGLARDPIVGWPTALAISGQSSVVLFADERAELRRAVAKELGRRKIATIPIDELERIENAAASSTLVLEGDQHCASPLSRAEVHARYFAGLPEITIEAACWDECRLSVTIPPPKELYLTSHAVKHAEDPKRWIAAVAQLSDLAYGIGGIGLSGIGGHVPPVRFSAPSWVGPWKKPPTAELFSALDPQASACAHPDPFVGLTYELRAVVDARGRVGRCEGESSSTWAREADAACVCRVLGELRFAPGSSKRRLWVEAIDDGGFGFQGGALTIVQPGTEVWIERLKSSLALERCAATHGFPAAVNAMISLQLASDGSVEDVRIDADLRDSMSMQWAQCVVGELHKVALPCRPPGIEVLKTRLGQPTP